MTLEEVSNDEDDNQVDLGYFRLFDRRGFRYPALGHSGLGRDPI